MLSSFSLLFDTAQDMPTHFRLLRPLNRLSFFFFFVFLSLPSSTGSMTKFLARPHWFLFSFLARDREDRRHSCCGETLAVANSIAATTLPPVVRPAPLNLGPTSVRQALTSLPPVARLSKPLSQQNSDCNFPSSRLALPGIGHAGLSAPT